MTTYVIFKITNVWTDVSEIKEALALECERFGDVKLVEAREAEGPEQLRLEDGKF